MLHPKALRRIICQPAHWQRPCLCCSIVLHCPHPALISSQYLCRFYLDYTPPVLAKYIRKVV